MSKYFINLRLKWIHEFLRDSGYINRRHLVAQFGISEPQCAIDFKAFRKRFPGYCEYNTKTKRYELCGQTASAKGAST